MSLSAGPAGAGGEATAARMSTRPHELRTHTAGTARHPAGTRTPDSRRPCRLCTAHDGHDDWNARARGEKPLQRADRAYAEILQEVRVAQTGIQILFAFLLALAFTTRFLTVTTFQRDLYVATLMLCGAATALLIAPAAFHRVVYRRRLKAHLVRVANRLALAGLAVLLLALVSALLLILDVTTSLTPALVLAGLAFAWFSTWWFVLPVRACMRHAGHHREPPR